LPTTFSKASDDMKKEKNAQENVEYISKRKRYPGKDHEMCFLLNFKETFKKRDHYGRS
jgi:hypothetical protein